jgi:beta-glucosidase
VDVTNTGTVAGKESIQLYLAAPAKTLAKPTQELKGFAKTRLLNPGEKQTLTLTLDARSLASFDPALAAWVAEPGAYTVKIGASSRDIRLKDSFDLAKTMVVKKENNVLNAPKGLVELKRF